MGPGYVTLYWDIENVADNECRYRLRYVSYLLGCSELVFSYTSTSNAGERDLQTVQLKDTNHYRFSGLNYETYYTFTITVIMGTGDAEAESESEAVTVGFSQRGMPDESATEMGLACYSQHIAGGRTSWKSRAGCDGRVCTSGRKRRTFVPVDGQDTTEL